MYSNKYKLTHNTHTHTHTHAHTHAGMDHVDLVTTVERLVSQAGDRPVYYTGDINTINNISPQVYPQQNHNIKDVRERACLRARARVCVVRRRGRYVAPKTITV